MSHAHHPSRRVNVRVIVSLGAGIWLFAAGLGVEPRAAANALEEEVAPVGIAIEVERDRIEDAYAELTDIVDAARESGDLSFSQCVDERKQRSSEALNLATVELGIATDPGSTPRERGLATAKLSAAADQLEALLAQAKDCRGSLGPSMDGFGSATEQDAEGSNPVADPTTHSGTTPVPPAIHAQQVLVASPSR